MHTLPIPPTVPAEVDFFPSDPDARWSRTIGALGEGTWQRIRGLHYGVVGCGRTGSSFASALGRLGVRFLTLVDQDVVEMSSLGENAAGIRMSDITRAKADALADAIRRSDPHANATAVVAPVSSLHALIALKACDVLVTCVDSDKARMVGAVLAALYTKIHLDIGTGIHRSTGSSFVGGELTSPSAPFSRRMGADVRLIVPGARCLSCYGGLTSGTSIPRVDASDVRRQETDWRRERVGSLLSLNQIATGLGLRLLEDLVCERISSDVWLRAEYSDAGVPEIKRIAPQAVAGTCPVCECSAAGDAGVSLVGRMHNKLPDRPVPH